jgi:hypothetical protein
VARPRTRLATPPEWLWPLSIVLQVASAAALTSYTYFFLDDWYFIAQARRIPLSIDYLRQGLFEHFSPITRLLDKLLIHDSTGSFALAHDLQLLMYAAAIVAFAFVVRTILGNRWTAFALTVLFGQSLFLIRLLNWWTATANILPSTIFGLLALGAYLRWSRSRSPAWMIASLASFFVSLLDYETAMLLPFYIAVVRLLILEREFRPRAWLAVARREWVIWTGYVLLDVAALINFYSTYYQSAPHPSLPDLLNFLGIAVFGTFIPALVGIKNPQSALGGHQGVIIACVVVALAAAAYFVYRRPGGWRFALAFVLIALLSLLPLGLARVAHWGVHTGKELYYQQSLQFMFLVIVALALRIPAGREPRRTSTQRSLLMGGLLTAAFAGYGVLFVTSAHTMARSISVWDPRRSLSYVRNFQASVRRTIARTGREPVLFNAQVPDEVVGKYDSYAIFFPMIERHVRFGAVTSPMYVASGGGALVPVSFHPRIEGLLDHSVVLRSGHAPARAATAQGAACVPRGAGGARLRIPLSQTARLSLAPAIQLGHRLPQALRLFLRMPAPAAVAVSSHGRWTEQKEALFPPTFAAGTSGQYIPLDMNARALAIDLALPAGACVTSLSVGSFARP